jgi:hypothetical protein
VTKPSERLPRPAAELERLAEYYDTHDTSAEMEPGAWVEPQPMATSQGLPFYAPTRSTRSTVITSPSMAYMIRYWPTRSR